ncbi:MAG TPA: hypothetical protein EYQ50_12860 [Verrucomicrobiales bacterium]|nr:hypothetical protein [Verrucomicrobiales bacterium]
MKKQFSKMPVLYALIVAACLTIRAGEIPNPAAASSREPNLLHGSDGQLYLSWVDFGPRQTATLRFSTWNEKGWSPARTVASGDNWFINWADFSSMSALADGTLVAHWLQMSSDGTYSYDVMLSLSLDRGRNWSKPLTPHRDGTHTEHGFVSILPLDASTFGVFWLDGRSKTVNGGDMALRFTTLGRDGRLGKELVVDQRVCECCQTSAAVLADGDPFVVYRDRSHKEVRDIGSAILRNGQVASSRTVYPDDWVIEGCPVNGPATDQHQGTVVVAWYTYQGDHSEVRVRFSANSAKDYGEMIRIDEGQPSGRVDVVLVDRNTAIVSWLEANESVGEIRWRVVSRTGLKQASRTLTQTLTARASGFPRIEFFEGSLFFAWTDAAKPGGVKTARFSLGHLKGSSAEPGQNSVN